MLPKPKVEFQVIGQPRSEASPPDLLTTLEATGDRTGVEEARALLAAIVASSDDAIVSKTLDGVITSWNGGAVRLFGYTPAEAIGKNICLIIPPDRLHEERDILARLRRGERIEHFETIRVAKDGRKLDISLTVSPVRDGGGRIIGASKVARDITDRKHVEEALREADRRKDEFLALLAHELRNPLAPLRNGIEVLRLIDSDPQARVRAHEMMERQLNHMIRIVDDLLDVSRITLGKLELRRARVRLADIIRCAVEAAQPLIEGAGHVFEVSLPSDPVILDADLTRLAQMFSNLFTNSAKYTPRGGLIRVHANRQGHEVVVHVQDNGIGIPAEGLPRIFDMFSQIDRSNERSNGGLGIGLALVRALAEMHGGTISAASPGIGKGSTFTVRLPLAEKPTPDSSPSVGSPETKTNHSRLRILVADDNLDGAESLSELLSILGNEVRQVHNGAAAVKVAGEFRPHLVLMDVGMPEMNGLDATRGIREHPWGREMKIIALTGWGQDGDRERSRAAGCNGHLVKPIALPQLQKLLAEFASV